jgi:hypothetical protein
MAGRVLVAVVAEEAAAALATVPQDPGLADPVATAATETHPVTALPVAPAPVALRKPQTLARVARAVAAVGKDRLPSAATVVMDRPAAPVSLWCNGGLSAWTYLVARAYFRRSAALRHRL